MKKLSLAAALLSVAILTGCVKEFNPNGPSDTIGSISDRENPAIVDPTAKYVPNELLVKFKRGISPTGRENALSRIGGRAKEHILTGPMKQFGDNEGIYVIHTPHESLDAVGRMKGLPEVEYAEPNYIYRVIPLVDANDYYYNNPPENIWGMMGEFTDPLKARMGCRAGEAWSGANGFNSDGKTIKYDLPKQTGSKDVYVAVIDEGVQYNHEEFQGRYNGTAYNNIFINPAEGTTKNRKDDDGNGYVDDFYGWNFATNNNTIYEGSSDDHGTHVAGTIGARGNNGKGVAGVVWDVKIITAKFLGINGGTTANAIQAVDYITDLKNRHKLNIVASNDSWGGGGYSKALHDAIARASLADILFVAAAGNEGNNNDQNASYPASYSFDETQTYTFSDGKTAVVKDNVIAVAALWLDGTKPSWSNYGKTSVDIFAPGNRIWSTYPGNTYKNYSGTSMATPHVTGAVALYAAANGITFSSSSGYGAQIKNAILKSARPTKNFLDLCVTGGRLDVHRAWQNIFTTLEAD